MNTTQGDIQSYAAVAAAWRQAYRQSLIDDKPITIPFSKPWRGSSTPSPSTEEHISSLTSTNTWDSAQSIETRLSMCYSPISSISLESFSDTESEEDVPKRRQRRFSWASSISSTDLDFGYDTASPPPSAEPTRTSESSQDSDEEEIASTLNIRLERFRVDRRKLEKLAKTHSKEVSAATSLFGKIMQITNTFIHWPRKLKPGARSQRNPFVRVYGTPENKEWAKSLILAHLQTAGPQLRINMPILSGDRHHIIGNGSNIFKIMNESKTEILFRQHEAIIHGSIEGVKQARESLRAATPLIMTFKLRVKRRMANFHDSPVVTKLESQLNVKVTFLSTVEKNIHEVLIKGTEGEARRVKEAVQKLSSTSLGKATDSPVQIEMKVSQELRETITKDDCVIIKNIMHNTLTKITLEGETSSTAKLTISGNEFGVHDAKRELMGYQRVELIFEMDDFEQDSEEILNIAEKHDVKVTIKQLEKINVLLVTIMGSERHVHQLYEAYEEVMRLRKQSGVNKIHCLKLEELKDAFVRENSVFEGMDGDIWTPKDLSEQL